VVATGPGKRLAVGDRVEAGGIDPSAIEQLGMLRWPIRADDADEPHAREKTGRVRKMSRRTTEQIVATLGGSFDIVNCDRSNNNEWHGIDFLFEGVFGIFNGLERWFGKTTQALRYSLKGKNIIAQGRVNHSAAKVGAALG